MTKKMRWFVVQNRRDHFFPAGWGNGYVVIPKGHPLHGKDYNDIDVDIHGGLTFSCSADEITLWKEIKPEDKGGWIVGFDTAHYQDNIIRWPESAVKKEAQRLLKQLKEIK